MTPEELKKQLKTMLVKELHLEGLSPEEIEDTTPLFGKDGLGLDSIDTVELVMLVDRDYGVTISDVESGQVAFQNIASLSEYICAHKK